MFSDAGKSGDKEKNNSRFLIRNNVSEKTVSNIFTLLKKKPKMFELEFYTHRKFLPKTKLI